MKEFVERAIAYVKAEVPPAEGGATGTTLTHAMSPVIRPLMAGVCVAYVVDEPDGLVFVQHHHLEQAGITPDELHMIGLRNLQKLRTGKVEILKHGEIYVVNLDGNFEASMILLEHFWQKEVDHLVENAFSFIIPSRDVLAFCDADSVEGNAKLRGIVEKIRNEGENFLSGNLFLKKKKSVDGA